MYIFQNIQYAKYNYNAIQYRLNLVTKEVALVHDYYDRSWTRYATKVTDPEQVIAALEQLLALARPSTDELVEVDELDEQRIRAIKPLLNHTRAFFGFPDVEIQEKPLEILLSYQHRDYTGYHNNVVRHVRCTCGLTTAETVVVNYAQATKNFTTGEELIKITNWCQHRHTYDTVHEQNTLDLEQIPEIWKQKMQIAWNDKVELWEP
jgi:hypothetical protein